MKQLLLTLLSIFAMAQINPNDSQKNQPCTSKEISLGQFQWQNRILVLFGPNSENKSHQSQMNMFSSLEKELLDRDLILISVFDEECSTLNGEIVSDSPAENIHNRMSQQESGYYIVLIGKNGTVRLRQNEVLEPSKLFRVSDRMPMRQREIRKGG